MTCKHRCDHLKYRQFFQNHNKISKFKNSSLKEYKVEEIL